MKDIYDGRCAKSPAYNNFGRRGVFNMQDPEEHRQRLKLLRHLFVFNVLLDMQPLFLANLDRLITELQERLNRPVDMLYWFRMFTLDNGGKIQYSDTPRSLLIDKGDVLLSKSFNAISGDQPPEYLESIDNAFLAWAIAGTFPYLHYFLKQIPYKPLQHFLAEGDHVYEVSTLTISPLVTRIIQLTIRLLAWRPCSSRVLPNSRPYLHSLHSLPPHKNPSRRLSPFRPATSRHRRNR